MRAVKFEKKIQAEFDLKYSDTIQAKGLPFFGKGNQPIANLHELIVKLHRYLSCLKEIGNMGRQVDRVTPYLTCYVFLGGCSVTFAPQKGIL